MNIVATSPLFPPAYLGGGPIRTIEAMLEQADPRHQVTLVTNNFDVGSKDKLVFPGDVWEDWRHAKIMYVNRGIFPFMRAVRSVLGMRPDAFYLNGLFNLRLSVSMEILSQLKADIPVAIAPRGELNRGALALKSRKKSLFIKSMRVSGLLERVIWHASSEQEERRILEIFGPQARVIVREDDTSLPEKAETSDSERHERLRAVFMSRLSPIKGLDIALHALAEVKNPVDFDIIGPEEDGPYVQECRNIAAQLPKHVRTRFLGAVSPEKSRESLSGYDVMILPTGGENFGHVIGEALSVSLPVILADTTPWSERIRGGGGVLLAHRDPATWGTTIDAYASMGFDQWKERRLNAAKAYNSWKATNDRRHFFDLLESELGL